MADVDETRALLRDECHVCGDTGEFTGRTEWHDGVTYAVVRCQGEGVDYTVWSERGADVLAAYERARAVARDDLGLVRVVADGLAGLTRASADPGEDEVRTACRVPLDPPLLGATTVRVDGGWLPVVELDFDTAQVRRADLDALFGLGQWLPRVHPGTPHQLAYEAASAASRVVVFASFVDVPQPDSPVTRLMWRVDLPSADQ